MSATLGTTVKDFREPRERAAAKADSDRLLTVAGRDAARASQ